MDIGANSRRQSRISEFESHLTILRPREVEEVTSVLGAIMKMDDEDSWYHKAQFISRTLNFCLGPGNIWRFSRHAYMYGNGAYFYLYTLYTWLFATSFLVFEIGMGQYFVKGFAYIFSICPLMQGITISMAFYCLVASIFYNLINVYSFLYLLSGFYAQMPHSYCSFQIKNHGCLANSTNQSQTSEYIYFFEYIIKGVDISGDKSIQWRNAGILILIMVLICLTIIFAVMRSRWTSTVISCVLLSIIMFIFVTSLSVKTSHPGLKKLFVPTKNDIGHLSTWIYPMEQAIVSLGLGAGPLLSFWPLSKIKHWSYKECLIVISIAFTCTILSGATFFNAAALAVKSKNDTLEGEGIQQHIILTQFFNTMPKGLSHISVITFNFLLVCTCFNTMLEHTHTMLLYINSYAKARTFKRTRLIIVVCLIFYGFGFAAATKNGFALIMSIDKNFIGTSVLILLSCEMIAMSYFYGVRNLCDDVEFVLGYVPNYYFQITWLFLPSLLLIFSICSIYLRYKNVSNLWDRVMLGGVVLFIICPIVIFGFYKLVLAIRKKNLRGLFNRLEIPVALESDDELKSAN